jgi:hypothetical protein
MVAHLPISNWPKRRRGLLILVVLIGGMTVFSLARGRPGDVEAGLIGGVIGATIAAIVAGVELVGWFLIRKRRGGSDQRPPSEQ